MNAFRKTLVDYLAHHANASAAEMSQILGRTPADIRYHLAKLLEEGLVTQVSSQAEPIRGRPAQRYALAGSAQLGNVTFLCSVLLSITPFNQENIKRLADIIVEPFESKSLKPAVLINQLLNRLKQLHYGTSWEARRTGPRIIFHHCPYIDLVHEHPELCNLDQYILSSRLCATVKEKHMIRDGNPNCVFDLLFEFTENRDSASE